MKYVYIIFVMQIIRLILQSEGVFSSNGPIELRHRSLVDQVALFNDVLMKFNSSHRSSYLLSEVFG